MAREWKQVLSEHLAVLSALEDQAGTLDAIAAELIAALRAGRRVYLLGNGGSAADAQHIAAELLGRFRLERPALPVMALTVDSSALTAIANDLGFEQVFSRQIDGLVQPGDVVWALSTSGRSANVLAAVRAAGQLGAVVIGFTGAAGEMLEDLCTYALRVPHHASDRIQEAHQLAYHYVCERVEAALAKSTA